MARPALAQQGFFLARHFRALEVGRDELAIDRVELPFDIGHEVFDRWLSRVKPHTTVSS